MDDNSAPSALSLVNLTSAVRNGAAATGNIATGLATLIGTLNSFPDGATPITATTTNIANATATATLAAGQTGVTTYISGFDITSGGATAASLVTVTVAGTITDSLRYTYGCVAGATSLNATMSMRFNPPIPASATNAAITVTLPALGAGNTNATVVAYGFQV